MNIPEQVKIGWRVYNIELDEHRGTEQGGDLYGQINYEQNKIYLYDKQDEDNMNVTLLHEILHGIGYLIGDVDFRQDEGLITALSENLYQVMKDNPKLFNEQVITNP